MENTKSSFTIVDYAEDPDYRPSAQEAPTPLPESMGYNLDTLEKARQWLSHPQNWFRSDLFVLKWDGLVPKISERKARYMIDNPHDDGLPWAAMYGQKMRRAKAARGDDLSEKETQQDGND